MTIYRSMRNRIIPAAFLCLCGPLASADSDPPDTSRWACKWCEFEYGVTSEFEGGVAYVSEDSFKFGQHTGLADTGGVAIIEGTSRFRNEAGVFWNLDAYLLGSDRLSVATEAGRQGRYDAYLSYEQFPNLIQNLTRTPLSGAGNLQLPANWVRADTTAGMTALADSLRPVSLETDRKRLTLGGRLLPGRKWTLALRFRSEEQDGRRSLGASIGGPLIARFPFQTQSAQIQMPVDSVTRIIDATAAYQASKWRFNVGYHGSFFDQRQESLAWENPFNGPAGRGADSGRMALPPDNQFHQVHGTFAYQLGIRTRVTARLAVGRMLQDDALLPYSVNPALQQALPRLTLDGEVHTKNYQLRLSSRPIRKLSLNASVVYRSRDNDTPRSSFDYVITDAAFSNVSRSNHTYDIRSRIIDVNGSYRFVHASRLSFGYKRKDIDRALQQIENAVEDSYWAAISYSPLATLDLTVKYARSDRDGDEFRLESDISPQQNPLIRKYNMADRERRALTGSVSYTPNGFLGFGLSAEYADDDYSESLIGLKSSEDSVLTADLSIAPKQSFRIYIFATQQDIESSQAGSQSFSQPTWVAETKDSFDTVGFTVKYQPDGGRFSFNFDYTLSESSGETDVGDVGSSLPFPDLATELRRAELYVNYAFSEKLSWRFGWLFEDYDADDWTRDGVDVETVPTVLLLGEESFSYKSHMPAIFFRYQF